MQCWYVLSEATHVFVQGKSVTLVSHPSSVSDQKGNPVLLRKSRMSNCKIARVKKQGDNPEFSIECIMNRVTNNCLSIPDTQYMSFFWIGKLAGYASSSQTVLYESCK